MKNYKIQITYEKRNLYFSFFTFSLFILFSSLYKDTIFYYILQKKKTKNALFSEKSSTFAVSKAEIEVINI